MPSNALLQQRSKGKGGPPFGVAQRRFITTTRNAISSQGQTFFASHDWMNIKPKNGFNTCLAQDKSNILGEAIYVKPLVVWIPHYLIPNHIPSCPNCERCDGIDVNEAKWVKQPKVLFGLRSQRYLDTMSYKCHGCKKEFYGYNERSMELDANKLTGLFNIHLSRGFAVDDELYNYVIAHSLDSTSTIHRRVVQLHSDQYLSEAMYYYRAVDADKVKALPGNVAVGDGTQRTIDSMLPKAQARPSRDEQHLSNLMHKCDVIKRRMEFKIEQYEGEVRFSDLLDKKANRNNIHQPFKGLGKAKLELLVQNNIFTTRDLLLFPGGNPAILPQWKMIVQDYYEQVKVERDRAMQDYEEVTLDIDMLKLVMEEEDPTAVLAEAAQQVSQEAEQVAETTDKPPPFSQINDTEKYNCRPPSKATIDPSEGLDWSR
ncbi:unknown protein [Seminavis robusta]|uniref:DUF6729 domain-containing protein n=1 Tax=Seminavis robusta TaxID=568900 RepID=A0A9N8HWB7_9STRA|nr:unknown protein [Seminavis robusta]|eukprot:Sro2138_g316080.1 n/a (429) ;mRNA; r:4455-5848